MPRLYIPAGEYAVEPFPMMRRAYNARVQVDADLPVSARIVTEYGFDRYLAGQGASALAGTRDANVVHFLETRIPGMVQVYLLLVNLNDEEAAVDWNAW